MILSFIVSAYILREKKHVLLPVLALYILSLYLTKTRVSLISFAVASLVYAFLEKKRMVLYLILFMILFAVLIDVHLMFVDIFAKKGAASTLQFRMNRWEYMSDMLFGKPFFGWGTKSFEVETEKRFHRHSEPHNIYFALISYTGFIGLSLYLILNYYLLKKAFLLYLVGNEYRFYAASFIALTIGLLISSMTTNITFKPTVQIIYWAFAGLLFVRPKEDQ